MAAVGYAAHIKLLSVGAKNTSLWGGHIHKIAKINSLRRFMPTSLNRSMWY